MPYAPQIQDQRGQIIMQGLAQGQQSAAAAASWLTAFLERQDKENQTAKAADMYFKANPEALGELNIHEKEYQGFGNKEKLAAMSAYTTKKTMAEALARQKQIEGQTAFEAARTGEINQGLAGDARFRTALDQSVGANPAAQGMVTSPMGGPTLFDTLSPIAPSMRALGQERTLGPEETLQLGLQSGVRPERIGPLAEALARMKQFEITKQAGAPEQTGDIVFNRKTGQFEFTPESKMRAQLAARQPAASHVVIPDPDDPVGGARLNMTIEDFKKEFPEAYDRMKTKMKEGTGAQPTGGPVKPVTGFSLLHPSTWFGPSKGDTVKQGDYWYQYDGQSWKPMKEAPGKTAKAE